MKYIVEIIEEVFSRIDWVCSFDTLSEAEEYTKDYNTLSDKGFIARAPMIRVVE